MEESTMNQLMQLSTKEKFLAIFENQDYYFDADYSKKVRDKAKSNLETLEFPTSKTEYWKYSRTNRIVKGDYKVQPMEDSFQPSYQLPDANRIVIVNGFVNKELSNFSDSDVLATSLSNAKEEHADKIEKFFAKNEFKEEIFASINTAFHQDGAFIYLPKNVNNEKPIHIISITTGNSSISQQRNLIVAEQGSNSKVVLREISENAKDCFSNMVSELYVGKNAFLEINRIQEQQDGNFQVSMDQVRLEADSRFKINTFTKSGEWVRNNLNIELLGENIETWLNGLYLTKDNQHVDNHTFVDHTTPNCVSHELYKGILNNKSTAVFNGKVHVRRPAQKTNAYQSNATILMSDEAKSYSKPELEIYADDVQCSHGSTTGQLDEEAIFYLRTRGISEEKARGLVLYAFALDVLEHIGIPEIEEEIEKFVFQEFGT